MPRIPDFTALGERPVPNGRTPIVSDQSGEILAQGIGQAGQTLGNLADRVDQFATASARSAVLSADVAVRSSLDGDPNYQTYEKRYQDSMQKALSEASKRIPDATSRALFEQQASLDVQRGLAEVRTEARRKEVDTSRASLDDTITNNRVSALQAPDEATRSAFISATVDAIAGAQKKGYLSAQEATNLRQAWTANYAEGYVAMQPFEEQIKMLSIPKNTLAEYIDPAKRVELLETAQRRRFAEENQQYELTQRALKMASDNAAKNGDKLLAEGNLTTAWIESQRKVLEPADYRYFYKQLSGRGEEGSAPRNVSLYADLREKAGLGQDVRDDARAALQSGAIRIADYNGIINNVETEHPTIFKRGVEYISDMSGASLMNPDPAAPQLKAAMLDQWNNWLKDHPKATDREGQSAYQDIVSHNMLVQRAGLPLPRLLVGGRFSPDLLATVKATMKAHEKGDLNDADYAREMEVLQRWKRTLEAEKAQVPPK